MDFIFRFAVLGAGIVVLAVALVCFVRWKGAAGGDGRIGFFGITVSGGGLLVFAALGCAMIVFPYINNPTDSATNVQTNKTGGWAYFGYYDKGNWSDKNFDLSSAQLDRAPRTGDTVIARVPTNIRSGPIQNTAVGWINQPAVGGARPGSRFRVQAVTQVDPGFYWIEIQPI